MRQPGPWLFARSAAVHSNSSAHRGGHAITSALKLVPVTLGQGAPGGIVFAVCCLLSGLPAFAQTTGSFSGTVLDATGAAIRGATVTATDTVTGRRNTAITDGAGHYTLSPPPARYIVRIVAPGFQGFEETGLALAANQTLTVGATLKVGAMTTVVQVKAEPDGYAAEETGAATLTDTPMIDVPQALEVITGRLLAEQDARTLNDALVDVSGVTPTKPEEDLLVAPIVRGFPAEVYYDGLPAYGATETANDPTSLVGAARIEVVKGPTSTVYGGGAGAPLGGLIDVVSKRPQNEASGFAAFRGGSFSTLDPFADINLPIGARAAVRATGEYQHQDSWIDQLQGERWSAQPSVLLHLDPQTELLTRGEYDRRDQVEYSGLPASPALAGQLDFNAYSGATTGQPRTRIHNSAETAELRQRLSDTMHWTLTARYYDSSTHEYGSFAYPGFYPPDPSTPTTYPVLSIYLPTKVKESMVDANLAANVRGLRGGHELLGDFNFDHTNFEGDLGLGGVPIGALDLAHPTYNLIFGAPPTVNTLQTNRYESLAGYAQDQVTYGRLHLLGSVRLTRFSLRQVQQNYDTDYVRLNPRVGGTFDIVHGVALYGAFATGFRGAVNFIGQNTPRPETSRNEEGGVKLALTRIGLSGTIAAFQQTRRNVTTVDPNNPLYSIQAGEERARGLEADATWEPMRSLSVLANYAYTGAEVTADTVLPVGHRLPRVPRHSGRVMVYYRVQSGFVKGFSFGAGATAFTRREIYLPNSGSTPGYATIDAHATYSFGLFAIEGSAANLADHRAFDP